MRRAALLGALALLASSCGTSKPAASAGEVAPRSTYALLGGRVAEVRTALDLLPEGPRLAELLERARVLTGSTAAAQVAVLDRAGRRIVAFERPRDRKSFEHALDAAGVTHARIRGWVAFSHSAAAVDEARHAAHHLAEARWFREPPGADATFQLRGLTVTAEARGGTVTARRTTPSDGSVPAAHALASAIPDDAIAAAAVHGGAAELERLGVARPVESGLGLRRATLTRLAPAEAVVFARPGAPVAAVTLLASGSDDAAAVAALRDLAPAGATVEDATLDGVPLHAVPLGAVDLYGGVHDGTTVVTDDAGVRLRSKITPLRPSGLPDETDAWAYLDGLRGLPALEQLAALAGTSLSPAFVRHVAPLASLLVYRTGTATHETLVVVAEKRR